MPTTTVEKFGKFLTIFLWVFGYVCEWDVTMAFNLFCLVFNVLCCHEFNVHEDYFYGKFKV